MNVEGLQLAARFAWSAKKCAGRENKAVLEACVVDNKFEGVEKALLEYTGMMGYLGILANGLHRAVFDLSIVHAYWLGGEELNHCPQKNIIPFHLTKVLKEAKAFEKQGRFDISKVNACMVRWGVVENMSGQNLSLSLNSLQGSYHQLSQANLTEVVLYKPGFFQSLIPGQIVAVHDGWAVTTITPTEEKELSHWTSEALKKY
jgi:hypothetical protein